MDRDRDIPMTFEHGVFRPDEPLDLPEGTRAIAHLSDGTLQNGMPDTAAFFRNKTIAELVAEQGVRPLRDASDLEGDWPPEDSIDEFLAQVRRGRK